MTLYPRLFSPLPIGTKAVKNRLVSTAHVTEYDERGLLSARHLRYLERKAAGGIGLLITFGSANVHQPAAVAWNTVNLWDGSNDDRLRELARGVHEHDCLLMAQATHMGRR